MGRGLGRPFGVIASRRGSTYSTKRYGFEKIIFETRSRAQRSNVRLRTSIKSKEAVVNRIGLEAVMNSQSAHQIDYAYIHLIAI